MLKTSFFPKIKKITKKYKKVNTQKERAELIFELKTILETYRSYAAKEEKSGHPGRFELKCAQLVAYIARSINIIATSYDCVKIREILAEMEERISKIERLRKQDKKAGTKSPKNRKRN